MSYGSRRSRSSALQITAIAAAVVLVVTGLIAAFSVSTINTNSDQVALHYNAGLLSSTTFEECIPRNSREWDGPGEKYYVYPAGQRTFDFRGGEAAEAEPYTVVSKDNQELTISGGLTFHLDTSCDEAGGMLRKFHEDIGLKFQPIVNDDGTTTDEWVKMLRYYIGQPLEKALTAEAQKYDWLALYNDPATRVKFEREINDNLADAVEATTGGETYFINFNLTLQKPAPRAELVNGLAAVQEAITQRQAVVEQNATVEEKLEQIESLVEVLGPYGYILYDAMQRCLSSEALEGCPTFLPVPPGGDVNVPAPPVAPPAED